MAPIEKIQREHGIVGREAELAMALAVLGAGRHLLLEGPVGVGKTTVALAVCSHLGRDTVRVDGDDRYSESKLTGWFDPPLVLKQGYREEFVLPGSAGRGHARGPRALHQRAQPHARERCRTCCCRRSTSGCCRCPTSARCAPPRASRWWPRRTPSSTWPPATSPRRCATASSILPCTTSRPPRRAPSWSPRRARRRRPWCARRCASRAPRASTRASARAPRCAARSPQWPSPNASGRRAATPAVP